MYPTGELKRLADRKVMLRARIAVRRWEMAAAAAEVARPVAAFDRGLQIWHRISPFVKLFGVSLGILIPRIIARRSKGKPTGRSKFAAFMAALPLIVRGINMVKAAHAAHVAHRAARL
jgi:hypothetical protein